MLVSTRLVAISSGAIRIIFPSLSKSAPTATSFSQLLFIQDAYRMSDFSTEDNEEVYEVEKILDHRKKRGRVRYLEMCSMASLLMSPCIE